jgi:hypothetical protein
VQQTTHQNLLPAFSKNSASKANRAGLAERCAEPAVQNNSEVGLARMGYGDQRLNDVERSMVRTAKPHAPATFSPRQSGPGSGTILSLVLLHEIHDSRRFPRVQEFVSSGCLVKGATASAGIRDGASDTKSSHAYLTWAFSEAVVLCLRDHPAGQQDLARREKTHVTGKALTVLAHT